MKSEVLKSNAEVLLREALSVLAGLKSYGFLDRSGSEADASLPILLDRACNVLSNPLVSAAIDLGPEHALDDPYLDQEVLGLDNDGQVICWDAPSSHEYACGEDLQGYGIANLKLYEISRVGVSVEKWLAATVMLQGDRDHPEGWSRNMFVKAHSTSEYGGEGPTFAKIVVDAAFVAMLLQLSNLCKKHGLSEVRVCDVPALWGGCDEDGMRLTCGELVVCGASFWFTDSPKHANFTIQTDSQQISKLIEAAKSGDGDVYLAEYDEEQLRQLVEGDEEGEVDDMPPPVSAEASSAGNHEGASAP